jgi:hypothetical protein
VRYEIWRKANGAIQQSKNLTLIELKHKKNIYKFLKQKSSPKAASVVAVSRKTSHCKYTIIDSKTKQIEACKIPFSHRSKTCKLQYRHSPRCSSQKWAPKPPNLFLEYEFMQNGLPEANVLQGKLLPNSGQNPRFIIRIYIFRRTSEGRHQLIYTFS